jgi:hypothetical protein
VLWVVAFSCIDWSLLTWLPCAGSMQNTSLSVSPLWRVIRMEVSTKRRRRAEYTHNAQICSCKALEECFSLAGPAKPKYLQTYTEYHMALLKFLAVCGPHISCPFVRSTLTQTHAEAGGVECVLVGCHHSYTHTAYCMCL